MTDDKKLPPITNEDIYHALEDLSRGLQQITKNQKVMYESLYEIGKYIADNMARSETSKLIDKYLTERLKQANKREDFKDVKT